MEQMITIVVPVYNAEEKLDRCVQSLLNQSYTNIEILLVNDGSRDNSLSICRKYAQQDSRVVVIDKPNGGVSSARNAGLDAAQGEFIMFCDSDDWVVPEWCECMAANYVDGDLLICDIARDDFVGSSCYQDVCVNEAERKYIFHFPMVMCSPVNKIYSRKVIEKHKIRFLEKLRLGEDFSFVLSYLYEIQGCIRFVNKKLYCYDVSTDGSLSKRAPEVEQCDLFYRTLTAAMEKLGATDNQSIATRNRFVIGHFEKALVEIAGREDISFSEKMRNADRIQKMESFRMSCDGLQWGNPIYRWCYHLRSAKGIVLFLVIRMLIKGK